MEGLFEIHISVDNSSMFLFRLWALDNDVKAIGIVGEIPELTFSKYLNGTHEKAINKAMSIARNLILNKITINRIRIEAIFTSIDKNIDNYFLTNPDSYFEFHIKYHIINSKDYYELWRIAKEFTNEHSKDTYVFVGFNSFKKNIEPIITLRTYKTSSEGSLKYKDLLMNKLKQNGFRTNEEIHKEYVFFDKEYSKL